jgi:outer membrane protein assembly factor BamA
VYPSTAIGADDAPDNAHGRTTSADALPVKRTEIIAVPNVGGNSDIGVEVGVAGSVIRFREGFYPYRYRVDAVAASSFKDDLRGFRLVQQYHVARIDIPQLIWPRLRLDTRTNFTRQVNATWFGVGNATSVQALPPPQDAASAYDYIEEHVRLRALLRIKTDTPFEVALGINVRYELPTAYVTSKLSNDLASGAVRGSKAAFLETLAAGFIVDTRDSEFMPRRGIFYQVGAAGTVGSAEDVRYGEASAVLAHFAPLGGPFFFASRMVGSFLFGTVPFYELQQGGVFNPQYLVGGSRGLRGVRLGRYAGKVKALANTELRVAPLPRFRVLRWSVLPGATAFFDAGRVWSDYEVRAEDGRKLDLKYSAGGGVFFQWDEASVFRVDAAYSPLKERDGDFPVSFYFESGFLF